MQRENAAAALAACGAPPLWRAHIERRRHGLACDARSVRLVAKARSAMLPWPLLDCETHCITRMASAERRRPGHSHGVRRVAIAPRTRIAAPSPTLLQREVCSQSAQSDVAIATLGVCNASPCPRSQCMPHGAAMATVAACGALPFRRARAEPPLWRQRHGSRGRRFAAPHATQRGAARQTAKPAAPRLAQGSFESCASVQRWLDMAGPPAEMRDARCACKQPHRVGRRPQTLCCAAA